MNDLPELQITIPAPPGSIPGELLFSLTLLDLEKVSLPQELFDPQTPFPPQSLIDRYNPILVIRDGSSGYVILDGCKRFLAARQQKKSRILCAILKTPLSHDETGLLRMALNRNRSHHLRERAAMAAWVQKHCAEDGRNANVSIAGISSKELSVFSQLFSAPEQTKNAVYDERIDQALLPLFLVFTHDDQAVFLETFSGLKLSRQTQREFFDWLPELAYLQQCSIKDILSAPAIRDTVNHGALNSPQKIEKIRTILYEQKYPQLSNAQHLWKKQSAALNPDPACVNFVPDPFFEKDRLSITITVTNGKKAEDLFKKCADIPAEQWQKLIYPVGAES